MSLHVYIDGNNFLTTNFKHINFIEWFVLSSNSNSVPEILSINDFLVDFLFDALMWLFTALNLIYSS